MKRLLLPLLFLSSFARAGYDPLSAQIYYSGGPIDPRSIRALASGTDSVTVTGSVAVSNFPATQAVSLASLPALGAGSALVGKVGIDQTTPGTTNKVSIGTDGQVSVSNFPATQPVSIAATLSTNATLQAGSALVGKVGIDQTTNGTTNRVNIGTDGTVAANLNAGSNTIGNVGLVAGSAKVGQVAIDQTTPGTTNLVQVGGSLPTGTNSIGTVGLNTGSNTIGKVDQGAGGTSAWTAKQTSQTVATYWGSFQTYTPVTAATNMIQLRGSATKTVRLKSLVICPSATAAGVQTVWLRKESTADTVGSAVFTTLSLAPTNSTQASATATLGHYGTANVTTAGTLAGTMPVLRVWFEITAGTTAGIPPCTDLVKATGWDSLDAAEFFTLNGTAQSISVSNNAAALAAGYKIDAYTVLFTEE